MAKSPRIKLLPLATRADFNEQVIAILELEVRRRQITAERDAKLLAINKEYDARLAPLNSDIKGRMALAKDYADANSTELLPKKEARSFTHGLARVGWRTGQRTVETRYGVNVAQAIKSLHDLGLSAFIRVKEELNKEAILEGCTDDKTLNRVVCDPAGNVVLQDGQPVTEAVHISAAGLKISQGESFYVEPASKDASTLKTEAA